MPAEQALEESRKKVETEIKLRLLKRGMTQKQLSDLIKENRQQVNRAVKGDTAPKSIKIRKEIYQVLGMNE